MLSWGRITETSYLKSQIKIGGSKIGFFSDLGLQLKLGHLADASIHSELHRLIHTSAFTLDFFLGGQMSDTIPEYRTFGISSGRYSLIIK